MKFFTFIMAFLAICSSAWGQRFKSGDLYYEITDEVSKTVAVTYELSSTNSYPSLSGAVTVPETVSYDNKVYTVTSIGSSAFAYCYGLTSITLPESLTSIGGSAFYYCYGLISITLPEGLTSIEMGTFYNCTGLTSITLSEGLTSIGEGAFNNCYSLTSITLPESLTSIGDYAFSRCSGLTSITIPSTVTTIGSSAFSGCSGLTSIVVETGNSMYCSDSGVLFNKSKTELMAYPARKQESSYIVPSSVTSIGAYAFSDCSSLTSITIPSSVTKIGDFAFSGCSGLTSITIPSNVTSIEGSVFKDCSSLTSITLPKGLNSIEYGAFSGCSSLTSITIPSSVTSIGSSAFSGCSGLTSITLPEGLKSIELYVFSGCSGLTSITIPSNVTSIERAVFEDCSSLTSIIVETGNSMYCSDSGVLFNKSKTELIAYPAGKNESSYIIPSSITSIGSSAFSDCSGLTSITIPSSITSISSSAFSDCSGLTSITLPDGLTSIGAYAFSGCSGLTSITIPSGVTKIDGATFQNCSGLTSITLSEGLTSIGYSVFSGCSGLTSITIPSSVTSIGSEAFSGCSGLTSITIPSNVTSIERAVFEDCSSLTSIIVETGNSMYCSDSGVLFNKSKTELIAYPAGKNESSYIIPSSVTRIGSSAFSGCSGLTSITLPEGLVSIGSSAFSGCFGLTSITLPEGLNTIESEAFSDCSGLTSITISSSVTRIGSSAFSGCFGLTSITLPEGLTSIDSFVFFGCSGLTSITLPDGLTSIGDYVFSGCSVLTSITIPSSVTHIGLEVFRTCPQLNKVVVEAVNPPIIITDPIQSNPDLGLNETAEVYVPAESLDAYRATLVWKDLNLLPLEAEETSSGELLVRSIGENISSLDGINGKPFTLYNVGRKCYVYLGEYKEKKGLYVMSDNPQNRNTFVFTIEKTGDGKYTFRNINGQYMPSLNKNNAVYPSDTPGKFEISASSDGKWIIKDPSTNLYFNGDANGTTFNGWDNGTEDNSKYEIRTVDAVALPLEISTIGETFDENTRWYRMKIGGEYVRYSKDETSSIPVAGSTANDFDNYLWSFAKDVNGRYVIYNKAAGADKVMTSLPATGNDIAVHLSDKNALGTDKNPSWDMYYSDAYPERVGFCLGRKDDYTRCISEQDGFLKYSEEKNGPSTLEIEAVENPSLYLSTNTFYAFRSQETGKYISSEPNGTGKHLMTDKGSAVEKTAFYISDDFRLTGCTGKNMKGGYTPESGSDTYRFTLQADGSTFYIKPSSTNNLYANNTTVDYWSSTHPRCNWLIEPVDMEALKNSIRNSRPVKNAVGSLKSAAYDAFSQALESPDASRIVEALRISNTPENLVEFNTSNYYRLMTSPKESGWNGVVRYLTSASDRLYGYDYNSRDASQIWNVNAEEGGTYTLESQGVYSVAPVASNVDVIATKDKGSACRFAMAQRSNQITYGFKNGDMFLHLKKATISSDKTINGYNAEEDACFWYLIEANSIDLTVSSAGYATFNYPFAVRLPEDNSLEAYIGIKATETSLILKPAGSVIPANTAVIISCPSALEEGTSKTYSLEILPENYEAENGEIAVQADENLLSGTLLPEMMPGDRRIYGLGKKTEIGFYRMNDTERTVGANKAYLDLTGNPFLQHVNGMTFSFDDHEGGTTGLENIRPDSSKEEYYDLQGRRVVHPTRGIYVTKSGKKVFFTK